MSEDVKATPEMVLGMPVRVDPNLPPSVEFMLEPPPLLAPATARIRVYREVAAFLEKNITTAEAHLAKLFPECAPDPVPVEAANIASATLAAIELKDSLLITAHELEKALNRPRILRPERSIKVVR